IAMDWLENRIEGLDWPEIRARELELHQLVTSIVERYEQIVQMGVMDDQGHLVASTVYPTPPADLGNRDYTQALMAGFRGTSISDPIVGRFTAKAQFVTARARRTLKSQFDGGMFVSAHQDYFVDFWRSVATVEGSNVTMFRADGTVLATSADALQPLQRLPPNSVLVQPAKLAEQGLFTAVLSVAGLERRYGFKKLRHYPVYVAYAVATEALFLPWREQLVRYGLLTMAISLSLMAM